jgi:hypothetical protein
MRRVLILLAAVQIVVVLLPASATGQEAPATTVGGEAAQEAEPTPDSEPAEPASGQAETSASEPDQTSTETTTETTPTETTPTETGPTETTPTETTPTETSPTEEPSLSACASQGTESVATDQSEYALGSTVHITGTGFATSCEASIEISPTEGGLASVVSELETSSEGQLTGDYVVDGAAGTYEVRVLGIDDAVLASTTFTVTDEESSPSKCGAQGTETVVTDKSEYARGSKVHITGDGYATSCELRVEITRPNGSVFAADAQVAPAVEEPDAASSAPAVEADDPSTAEAEADETSATGTFRYDFALGNLTGRYEVRVLGAAGEALASTTFAVKAPGPTSCGRRGTESIATDKADYSPGETVHMTGRGYAPSCLVKVKVIRPDGSVVRGDGSFTPGVDQVRTTARGRLAYDYVLNGIEGTYRVRVLGAGNAVLATTTFTDQIRATPSDPRATFFSGNATTCAQVGYPDAVQIGADDSNDASDQFVEGTTTGIDPDMLQVEITAEGTAAAVVIDAVVVKGGDGYNVYEAPFVPPTLPSPQNYISPENNGGNIANIGHWFVCYSFGEIVPDVGNLLVLKRVISPTGPTVEPLPTEFTVEVTCSDGTTDTVTFGLGGGVGATIGGGVVITGIEVGSTCTVEEQGTEAFPEGSVVSYFPDSTVTIGEGVGVAVVVTNDFSGVETQEGDLVIDKVVDPAPPPGVELPDSFPVIVACTDGTRMQVSVPAGGSVTVDGIEVDDYCAVHERIRLLPPEMEVTYSVDDPSGIALRRLAIVQVAADPTTVEVTITNDPSNIPVEPPDGGPPDGGGGGELPIDVPFQPGAAGQPTQPTGDLPFTGAPAVLLGGIGLVLIAGGLALASRRKS